MKLLKPVSSSALAITGPGFKRLGPSTIQDATAAWRGNLRPDLVFPSYSQSATICNARPESIVESLALVAGTGTSVPPTHILYVGSTGPTVATQPLTLTGIGIAAETMTIGTRVYTFRATVGATADEILVEATAAAQATTIRNAINVNGLGGYGSATTQNTQVWASSAAGVVTVTAFIGGTVGNAIATTETLTNGSWGAATLTGGLDDADVDAGVPVTILTPYTFDYSGDAVPTLFVNCAQTINFTVLFHGA